MNQTDIQARAVSPTASDATVEVAREKLMEAMRRAFTSRRQVLEIGEHQFRWQRRNERWDDGDQTFEALASGVFIRMQATSGGKPTQAHWVHLGPSDDLEDFMTNYLPSTHTELEAIRINISANAVLHSMAAERSQARTASASRPRP